MKIGIACDHGGFELKQKLVELLTASGHAVEDFGATQWQPGDDFPDYVVPLARAVSAGKVERGLAVCGSGVGASIAANKVAGARAALVHDIYSAHQGVEHDDMNILCLGGRVVGNALAWDLVQAFIAATFSGEERFRRRLAKIQLLEVTSPFET